MKTLCEHVVIQIEQLVKANPGVTAVSEHSKHKKDHRGVVKSSTKIQVVDSTGYNPVAELQLEEEGETLKYASLAVFDGEQERFVVNGEAPRVLGILARIESAIFEHLHDSLGFCEWLEDDWGFGVVIDYEQASPGELYFIYLDETERYIRAAVLFGTPSGDDENEVVWVTVREEGMGPTYTRCPERLLRRLTPTTDETANWWRDKCWEEAKREPRLKRETAKEGTKDYWWTEPWEEKKESDHFLVAEDLDIILGFTEDDEDDVRTAVGAVFVDGMVMEYEVRSYTRPDPDGPWVPNGEGIRVDEELLRDVLVEGPKAAARSLPPEEEMPPKRGRTRR